jgi:hypothetical protein
MAGIPPEGASIQAVGLMSSDPEYLSTIDENSSESHILQRARLTQTSDHLAYDEGLEIRKALDPGDTSDVTVT